MTEPPPAPVPQAVCVPEITHFTVGDTVTATAYNWHTREWSLAVDCHLSDGRTVPSALVLDARQARALAYGLRNPPLPEDPLTDG